MASACENCEKCPARWTMLSGWILGMFLGLIIGFPLGATGGRSDIRREAVKEGHAIYVNDQNGDPQFIWKKQ